MRFSRFEIRNFKGIEHAIVDLIPAGANVFTLIGLNESGKTTVLEAVDDFPIRKEGESALYGSENNSEYAEFVPKHKKADFTGRTTVVATVSLGSEDV